MDSGPNGVLNLYKPSGPTSHDCIARLRKALGVRRVGHAGTLDPMASGVLVVGVGHGTRVLEYLQGLPKTYRAGLELGTETDTQDTTGRTLAEADASAVTEAALRQTLERFRGEVMQVPPMVSALKVGGKKLYELARRGETIDREARPVTVYEMELLSFEPGPRARAEIRVRCSAGTYIRTLCHDVGQALGVGGVMSALEREAVGPFRAAEAVPLDRVDGEAPLIPLSDALQHLPSMTVDETQALRLAHGQFIPAPEDLPDGAVRVLGPDGSLRALAIARGHGEARLLAPEKVFVTADAARSGA
jgi:tRNA pseudouridine55 synthase